MNTKNNSLTQPCRVAVLGDLRTQLGWTVGSGGCLTFYRFPEAHWSHLRTTNVIESPFASVRLRTNAAKRFKKTRSGLCLVHQVMLRLSRNGRHLKSAHLCGNVPLPTAAKKKHRKKRAA